MLIVEDNLDAAHVLALLIAHMGHKVEYAIDGDAAVIVAKRFLPDAVLLDIGLPGLNGLEVCKKLKADPDTRHARIVILSSYAGADHRARTAEAGCDAHLEKPASADDLYNEIERS